MYMELDKKDIDVIHEDDLIDVLKKIGFYDKLLENKVICKFCNSTITLENIHSILPQSDTFSFICDNPTCIETLIKYLDNKSSTNLDLNI
ncbi:TPA: hypothetical protein DIC38_02215 [Candidatus Nomurabacteria bacterium]|nr:MAG: hypothetical protein O210_OD1C00001G0289 [Parcubacteria bacterium RAAC4_OD1_1]HCY26470.1 hypothetical protein [Candidatus Nomurabacteria bacterium]